MNIEIWYIVIMSLGGVLFALGGTQISDTIPGKKWLRRFILPIMWGLIAFFIGHFDWWRCLIFTGGTVGAFCLPYGSKTPYWGKALTATAFVAPSAIFGIFSLWQIIVPITFLALFLLSNFSWTKNYFVWKVCEFLTGTIIGINFVTIIYLHSL